MKIDLYMKDANGVKARIVAEGSHWDALQVGDIEAVKRFEPVEYCEIVVFRDDGSIFRHAFVLPRCDE